MTRDTTQVLEKLRDSLQPQGGEQPRISLHPLGVDDMCSDLVQPIVDRQEIGLVPEDERKEARDIAEYLHAEVLLDDPRVVARLGVDTAAMDNEAWLADQLPYLGRGLGALAIVFVRNLERGSLKDFTIDSSDIVQRFSAEYLVTSALLQWPPRAARRFEPALYYNPEEIVRLRLAYPEFGLPGVRWLVSRERRNKEALPGILKLAKENPGLNLEAASILYKKSRRPGGDDD